MDQRSLQAFQTLADTLHFGKTSQLCHMTPSTLSRMIQRLEEEVGTSLFERNNREVELTQAGEEFYHYAKEMIERWESLQSSLHPSDPSQMKGALKIYCTVTAAYSVLPKVMKEFRKAYPHIKLNIETGLARYALTKLDEGSVDIAIAVIENTPYQQIDCIEMLETPLVLVQANSSPFIPTSKATKKQLSTVPFILPESGILTTIIRRWFDDLHVTPTPYSFVEGHEAILSLVSAGFGVSIVPEIVLRHSYEFRHLSIIQPPKTLPSIKVGMFIKKSKKELPVYGEFWRFG